MKRITAGILSLVLAVPAFVPLSASAVAPIDALDFSGPVDNVTPGTLPNFGQITTSTSHISVEEYGSNSNWAKWESGYSSWHGFGTETPTAVDDGSTLYALRLAVHVESSEYEIVDHPSIDYNGHSFTETGNTMFQRMGDWGGYVYIDLGQATTGGGNEGDYTLTFDFNGGATFGGKGKVVHENIGGFGMDINEANLISCFEYNQDEDRCLPIEIKKGKEFSHVTVNGVRYELDTNYDFNQDTTIKYFWNDKDLKEFVLEDGNGNSVTFDGDADREYYLEIEQYGANMTEEELNAAGVPVDLYEAARAMVLQALGDNNGTLLSFISIEVYNDGDMALHEGPFKIRIKMTDEMAEFNTFKLVYLEEKEDGSMVAGEEIALTEEDGYLVGILPHLSAYALVGSVTPDAPNTGAFSHTVGSAEATSMIGVISLIAIIGCLIRAKKHQE